MSLRKWWVRLFAPTLEYVACGTCPQWFWRVVGQLVTYCPDCAANEEIALRAQKLGRPLW